MTNRRIDVAALQEHAPEIVVRVRIVRRNFERLLKIGGAFGHAPFLDEGAAEIVIAARLSGLQFNDFLKLGDRLIRFAVIQQGVAQIAVRHPGVRIAGNRRAPERFDVGVLITLPPGQKTESQEQRGVEGAALDRFGGRE